MTQSYRAAWLTCGLLLAFAARVAAEPRIPGEVAIESKLMAPCCWVQTLDVHESPLASELRLEVRTKLQRGVPAAEIESDLVARYGEQLWAIPPGHDPRTGLMNLGFGAMGLALLGLCILARRFRRRGRGALVADGGEDARSEELDSRLDAELQQLER